MVSIADVARRAGVSPTTVSHALSGKRAVSSAVHARVVTAMDELGYVPSRAAQHLASGRSRLVGLVVPDIANGFFAELAQGVERAALEAGYNVVLCTTGFDHAREVSYLELIRSRAFDGVVYAAGAPPTTSELTRLLGDLPLVLVDEELPGAGVPVFVSDNRAGGRMAAEHLLALGHRRAVVLGTAEELSSSRERLEGFTELWSERTGAAPLVATGSFTVEGGRAAAGSVLDRLVDGSCTALFAVNDLMALGAVERLEEAGLGVPARVSVVGFDDSDLARFARPRLTTLRQDVAALGGEAARCLLAALLDASRPAGDRTVLPVELVVRDSTAPPTPTPTTTARP